MSNWQIVGLAAVGYVVVAIVLAYVAGRAGASKDEAAELCLWWPAIAFSGALLSPIILASWLYARGAAKAETKGRP